MLQPGKKTLPSEESYSDYLKALNGLSSSNSKVERILTPKSTGVVSEELSKLSYLPSSAVSYDDMNRLLGYDQSNWSKANNTFARLVPNIVTGAVGYLGAMADIEDYAQIDNEAGNWLTKAMNKAKEATNEAFPVYGEQAKTLDLGNPNWWFQNGGNLAESMGSFVLAGGVVGALTGGLGLSGTAATVLSATALTQAESVQSAMDIYDRTYEKGKKAKMYGYDSPELSGNYGTNLSPEEYARELAGRAAANTINVNRANILLNLTSAGMFVKSGANTLPKLLEKVSTKRSLDKIGAEAIQEFLEEEVNLIAEKEGERTGGISDKTWRDYLFTDEALEAGILGAIGGAGQTLGSIAVGNINNKAYKGKIANYKEKYEKQQNIVRKEKDILNNPKSLLDNISDPGAQVKAFSEIEKIKAAADKEQRSLTVEEQEQIEDIQARTLEGQVFRAYMNGTLEHLKGVYTDMNNLSEEEAQKRGFHDGSTKPNDVSYYKNIIGSALNLMNDAETTSIELKNKKVNSRLLPELFQKTLNVKRQAKYSQNLQTLITELENKIAPLESEENKGKFNKEVAQYKSNLEVVKALKDNVDTEIARMSADITEKTSKDYQKKVEASTKAFTSFNDRLSKTLKKIDTVKPLRQAQVIKNAEKELEELKPTLIGSDYTSLQNKLQEIKNKVAKKNAVTKEVQTAKPPTPAKPAVPKAPVAPTPAAKAAAKPVLETVEDKGQKYQVDRENGIVYKNGKPLKRDSNRTKELLEAPVVTPVVTPEESEQPAQPVSEVEAKKAEIERLKKLLFINNNNGKLVVINGNKGVLLIINDNRIEIELDNRVIEYTIDDIDTYSSKTEENSYAISNITENGVTVNGVDYTINTDSKGNIISLSPTNKPKQTIKNNKLIIAVEIERNKLEINNLEEIQEGELKDFLEKNNYSSVSNILNTIYNINFTETIDNALEKLYNNQELNENEKLQLGLWLQDVFDRLSNLFDKKNSQIENETLLNAYDNLEVILSLLYNKPLKKTPRNEKSKNVTKVEVSNTSKRVEKEISRPTKQREETGQKTKQLESLIAQKQAELAALVQPTQQTNEVETAEDLESLVNEREAAVKNIKGITRVSKRGSTTVYQHQLPIRGVRIKDSNNEQDVINQIDAIFDPLMEKSLKPTQQASGVESQQGEELEDKQELDLEFVQEGEEEFTPTATEAEYTPGTQTTLDLSFETIVGEEGQPSPVPEPAETKNADLSSRINDIILFASDFNTAIRDVLDSEGNYALQVLQVIVNNYVAERLANKTDVSPESIIENLKQALNDLTRVSREEKINTGSVDNIINQFAQTVKKTPKAEEVNVEVEIEEAKEAKETDTVVLTFKPVDTINTPGQPSHNKILITDTENEEGDKITYKRSSKDEEELIDISTVGNPNIGPGTKVRYRFFDNSYYLNLVEDLNNQIDLGVITREEADQILRQQRPIIVEAFVDGSYIPMGRIQGGKSKSRNHIYNKLEKGEEVTGAITPTTVESRGDMLQVGKVFKVSSSYLGSDVMNMVDENGNPVLRPLTIHLTKQFVKTGEGQYVYSENAPIYLTVSTYSAAEGYGLSQEFLPEDVAQFANLFNNTTGTDTDGRVFAGQVFAMVMDPNGNYIPIQLTTAFLSNDAINKVLDNLAQGTSEAVGNTGEIVANSSLISMDNIDLFFRTTPGQKGRTGFTTFYDSDSQKLVTVNSSDINKEQTNAKVVQLVPINKDNPKDGYKIVPVKTKKNKNETISLNPREALGDLLGRKRFNVMSNLGAEASQPQPYTSKVTGIEYDSYLAYLSSQEENKDSNIPILSSDVLSHKGMIFSSAGATFTIDGYTAETGKKEAVDKKKEAAKKPKIVLKPTKKLEKQTSKFVDKFNSLSAKEKNKLGYTSYTEMKQDFNKRKKQGIVKDVAEFFDALDQTLNC